jgi:hypothetical protein
VQAKPTMQLMLSHKMAMMTMATTTLHTVIHNQAMERLERLTAITRMALRSVEWAMMFIPRRIKMELAENHLEQLLSLNGNLVTAVNRLRPPQQMSTIQWNHVLMATMATRSHSQAHT